MKEMKSVDEMKFRNDIIANRRLDKKTKIGCKRIDVILVVNEEKGNEDSMLMAMKLVKLYTTKRETQTHTMLLACSFATIGGCTFSA